MIWDVLVALVIFHSLCWFGKRTWKKWREEEDRREQHRARRLEQHKRAFQNRKARRKAWIASRPPELRAIYEKVFADDL